MRSKTDVFGQPSGQVWQIWVYMSYTCAGSVIRFVVAVLVVVVGPAFSYVFESRMPLDLVKGYGMRTFGPDEAEKEFGQVAVGL